MNKTKKKRQQQHPGNALELLSKLWPVGRMQSMQQYYKTRLSKKDDDADNSND